MWITEFVSVGHREFDFLIIAEYCGLLLQHNQCVSIVVDITGDYGEERIVGVVASDTVAIIGLFHNHCTVDHTIDWCGFIQLDVIVFVGNQHTVIDAAGAVLFGQNIDVFFVGESSNLIGEIYSIIV